MAAPGAAIDYSEHGVLNISATRTEAAAIRKLGFQLEAVPPTRAAPHDEGVGTMDFPSADSGYHNYAEMIAEVNRSSPTTRRSPRKQQHRHRYEGRDMLGVKISDNVGTDENEPEVLFDAHQHAREHLTVEMALYLLHLFADNYATDTRISNVVNSREIWIVPKVNPDGAEYDIATGTYRSWRKNRQPNSGSSLRRHRPQPQLGLQVGLLRRLAGTKSLGDLPRAVGRSPRRRPGCCATSSTAGASVAFSRSRPRSTSTPTRELVLWPYGYTTANTATGMTPTTTTPSPRSASRWPRRTATPRAVERSVHHRRREHRLAVGDAPIFAYTFEMYPGRARRRRLLPAGEVIAGETSRNKEAVLLLAEYADCPYRVIGKQATYC